jgi:hypothetical protein
MRKRHALALLITVATFAVAGCGSGDDAGSDGDTASSGSPTTTAAASGEADGESPDGAPGGAATELPDVDACELLSTEQVTEVLGEDVNAPEPSVTPTSIGCAWFSAAGRPGDGVTLTVLPAAVFDTTLSGGGADGYTLESVDGLGEKAYFLTPTASGENPVLSVKDGDTSFTIFLKSGLKTVEQTREGEQQLALEVLAAL